MMDSANRHADAKIKGASDRSFGVVFGTFFLIVALYPLIYQEAPRFWAMIAGGLIYALAAIRPRTLAYPNRAWFRLGLILNRIVSPVVLGMLFYLVVTPTGVLLRLTGKRPLQLKWDPEAKSYWIRREPPGPPPNSMNAQF